MGRELPCLLQQLPLDAGRNRVFSDQNVARSVPDDEAEIGGVLRGNAVAADHGEGTEEEGGSTRAREDERGRGRQSVSM